MGEIRDDDYRGLKVDRTWETLPADGRVLAWSVDHEAGLVQGPLDLAFLDGKQLVLNLDDGQVALLVRSEDLEAIFLPGSHHLTVGGDATTLTPDGQLVFLLTSAPVQLRWREGTSLHVIGDDGQDRRASVIGHCTCLIGGPARFWRCFLAGVEEIGEEYILKVIDTLVRSRLEAIVADAVQQSIGGAGAAQTRLTQLTPEEFSEELQEYGLECVQIAVYTATPPVEESVSSTAGQFPCDGDNKI